MNVFETSAFHSIRFIEEEAAKNPNCESLQQIVIDRNHIQHHEPHGHQQLGRLHISIISRMSQKSFVIDELQFVQLIPH